MRAFLLAALFMFMCGCASINECGVSSRYYAECVEGYDAQGAYFKKCPHNNIYDSCKQEKELDFEDCLNCN
ncbi:MAG: hypothetical protein LBC09_03715 [Helicobacteraceae bacterium]|jgi:hypothetical protein|nr:hypothetical protein [Helicobacteraceae bacterium]